MAVATAIALGSLALGAYSTWKAGKAEKAGGEAQRRAAESQAELADFNAGIADMQAKDAITRGREEESRYRLGIDQMVATQRAGYAAGNIDVGFGSARDVRMDTRHLGELDALTIRTNAAREAWGFKVEGDDLRKRAEIARREGVYLEAAGRQRASAAYLSGATSLLGGTAGLVEARYGTAQARRVDTRLPSRRAVGSTAALYRGPN